MSHEDFVNYYANQHTPLCVELLPILKKCKIRRNFLLGNQIIYPQGFSGELEYDVVTESIWSDPKDFNQFLEDINNTEIQEKINEDEKNLFKPGSIRVVMVEVSEHNNK
ncbi:hypothetical protein JCM19274_3225 [Algibacter lectus]|uniref:EthD domain-containing protein n=2 Tax=Algibacter lectus TaxID=221126 RepID=A0A090X1M4_9FLAO|nr:hypothetical protein JCM19274_3225 [Algibacter lectus]